MTKNTVSRKLKYELAPIAIIGKEIDKINRKIERQGKILWLLEKKTKYKI
jgi:hypothetical protein